MKLTTHEQERVLLFGVAEISRRRWKRGVKLNYIEASAIIMDELLERGRAGVNDITELMEIGFREKEIGEELRHLLEEVMDGRLENETEALRAAAKARKQGAGEEKA